VNGIIAALRLVAFATLSIGLGSEIYRCDVLLIELRLARLAW
jgi:hypothetical protein